MNAHALLRMCGRGTEVPVGVRMPRFLNILLLGLFLSACVPCTHRVMRRLGTWSIGGRQRNVFRSRDITFQMAAESISYVLLPGA